MTFSAEALLNKTLARLERLTTAEAPPTCPQVSTQAQGGAPTAVSVHVTGVGAKVDPRTGDLFEKTQVHEFVCKPVPLQAWVRKPWISPSQSYLGYPGIGLEILPSCQPSCPVQAANNDKANLRLALVPYGETFYFGFAMNLGKFDVPKDNILLAQMWQGAPYGPPISLQIVPNHPDFPCEVRIRNNATGGNPSAPLHTLPIGSCRPGAWHTFRFGVKPHCPGMPGTGELVMWHNDMFNPVATWTGDIGYDPSRPVDVNGVAGRRQSDRNANGALSLYFGPYRSKQQARAQTFWANLKVGNTPESADPTKP